MTSEVTLETSNAECDDSATYKEPDILDVNVASADDLHSVGGLAKPMAKKVVEMRDTTGQVRD